MYAQLPKSEPTGSLHSKSQWFHVLVAETWCYDIPGKGSLGVIYVAGLLKVIGITTSAKRADGAGITGVMTAYRSPGSGFHF